MTRQCPLCKSDSEPAVDSLLKKLREKGVYIAALEKGVLLVPVQLYNEIHDYVRDRDDKLGFSQPIGRHSVTVLGLQTLPCDHHGHMTVVDALLRLRYIVCTYYFDRVRQYTPCDSFDGSGAVKEEA